MKNGNKQKRSGKQQETALTRHKLFAEAMLRLGTATAALREVYPASRNWTPNAQACRAADLAKHPNVIAHVQLLSDAARQNPVAQADEITRFLAETMRGNIKESIVKLVKTAEGQCPVTLEVTPGIGKRIIAAKTLSAILGYDNPKQTDPQHTPAVIPPHIANMTDEELSKAAE